MEIIKYLVFVIILCVVGIVMIAGIQEVFSKDEVYIAYNNEDIFHKTPICPLTGNEEEAIEYMEETGEITGCKGNPTRECMEDPSFEMCRYCFSELERSNRDKHLREIWGKATGGYEMAKKNAKKLREQKEREELKKECPKMFE